MRLRILQNTILSLYNQVKKFTYTLQIVRVLFLVLLSAFLLVGCYQKQKKSTALLFEKTDKHITVSNEDYAMIFDQDQASIQLGADITAPSMKLDADQPKLINNQVLYENIAEDADLVFYDKGNGNAGYDIRLRPRANLEEIKIKLEDAQNAYITPTGELVIPVENGEIRHSKPYSYQEIDHKRIEISSRFTLEDGFLGFELGEYDDSYAVVIDPSIRLIDKLELEKVNPSSEILSSFNNIGTQTYDFTSPPMMMNPACPVIPDGDFEAGSFPGAGTTFAFAGGTAVDFVEQTPDSWSQATDISIGGNYWVESTAALSGDKYVYQFSSGTTTASDDACSQYDISGLSGNMCYQICVDVADARANDGSSGLAIEFQENNSGPFHYGNFEVADNPAWDDNALTTIPWEQVCYDFVTEPATTGGRIWVSASIEAGTAPISYIVIDDVSVCSSLPSASVFAIQPSCTNGTAGSDGYLQISAVTNGNRYHFSLGNTFDDNGGADTYANATPIGVLPEMTTHDLPNPSSMQDYTVRIYNGTDACFTDVVVTMNEQDCDVGCSCNEYIYLNDVDLDVTHKFIINSNGSLSEIGSPWMSGLVNDPHGIFADNNGNIYIGEVNSFGGTGGVSGMIKKFNSNQDLLNNDVISNPDFGYNMYAKDSVLYIAYGGLGEVHAYNLCTGDLIGAMEINKSANLGPFRLWGFYIDDEYWYTVQRNSRDVRRGLLDPSKYTNPITEQSTLLFNVGAGAPPPMGLTRDANGNFFIVFNAVTGGFATPEIRKYSPTGTLLTTISDGTNSNNIANGQTGFWGSRGIVYSENTNLLYVSSFDNCIAVFDTSLVEQTALNIGNPDVSEAKGLNILTECCPTNNNLTIDTALCGIAINQKLYLQDFLCMDVLAEGQWTEVSSTGMTFDACDNSVTLTALGACGSFTLSSDGTGSNAQCGAFKITVNIRISNLELSATPISCTDNMDDSFTANYDIAVDWGGNTCGQSETLTVTQNGATIGTADLSTSANPAVFPATIVANGIGEQIFVVTSSATACTDTIIFKTPVPCPTDVDPCASMAGCIGGNVFEDFNYNGIDDANEPGVQGIQIQIYDCNNTLVGTGYSDSDGDWQVCSLTDGVAYRVEFILPEAVSCWAKPTHIAGGGNQSDIQFLTSPACTQFSVSSPTDYCQEDPEMAITCYESGDGSGNTNQALISWTYTDDGIPDKFQNNSGVPDPSTIATIQQVGTVWGMTYEKETERIYATAYTKRHVSLGPLGTGGVYITSPTAYIGSFDLQGVIPNNGGAALNFGAITRSTVAGAIDAGATGDTQLSQTPTQATVDLDAFDKVGKTAMGDTDISEDGNYLWTVNLNEGQQALIKINLKNPIHPIPTNGSQPNGTIVERFLISDMSPPSCTNGVFRPWGLGFHKGVGYLGGVCSAESAGGTADDLVAYVLSFDPNNPTILTPILSFDLDFDREAKSDFSHLEDADWRPWADDAGDLSLNDDQYVEFASPMLSDIEFASNGDMVIGMADRYSHQLGFQMYEAYASGHPDSRNLLIDVEGGGDTYHACFNGAGWDVEGSVASCANSESDIPDFDIDRTDDGPFGNGEWYWSDYWRRNDTNGHLEITHGGLGILKGKNEVVSNAFDPILSTSNTSLGVNTQGTIKMSTEDGSRTGEYMIVNNQGTDLGKSGGLSEPIFLCNPAPLEIGNYVWCDSLQNGIQDACERGINDLIVQLYDRNGVLVGQDTTSNAGQYYFNENNVDTTGITVNGSGISSPVTAWSGMSYSTSYSIVFGGGQFAGDEFAVGSETYDITSFVNVGSNDNIDSDVDGSILTAGSLGVRPNGLPFIEMTTGAAGCGDHKYDLGLTCTPPAIASIGNYVWLDENSDGLQDAGEPGIPNVRVILRDENGVAIDSTITDSDGGYLFPDLPEAMYFVDVDETSLPDTDGNGATQDLTQTTILTNVIDGNDADTDNDDGDFGNKDHSGNGYKITLDEGEENLTADFGYNYNPTDDVNDPMGSPVGAIGDRVWYDADQDGVQDPEEAGVEGVTVKLIAASTVTIGATTYNAGDQIATDVTNANGNYLFDGLPAGAYTVMVMEMGSPIDGYEQTGDPDHFGESEADNPDDTVEDDGMTTNPVVLGPGDVFLNVDFGYDNGDDLGAIGDFVWLDADADGNGPNAAGSTGTAVNQGAGGEDDAAETPIAGVSVALIKDTNGDGKWDEGEPIIASDVTDENGLYYFPGLPAGNGEDYLVIVTDTDNVLDGLKPTYDSDGDMGSGNEVDVYPVSQMSNMELGISSVMNLTAGMGNEVLDQDFGYTPEDQDAGDGLIGDYVWYDENRDGVQDAEESGIEGVIVELYDLGADEMIGGGDDVLLATTTTNENGYYYFGDLPVDGDGEGYQVKIAESGGASGEDNFAAGGVLEGLENTFDPDNGATDPDDNMGGVVSLTTADPIDLDQDFGYVGDDANTLGSIGNQVWEDVNADGVYEPNGADGVMGTADDETPIAGVTIDLYRDLDGNGEIDPGEPRMGTTTTDVNGMYLFDELPLDDYVVDVTDTDGKLAGYWHSIGGQDASTNDGDDPMDNSKEDAFAVTIDNGTPDNLNVDFGYYKEPAALGNYVWLDVNGNGLQDDDETGINDIVVTLTIMYPDGTTITLKDTTRDDASGNTGFYTFPNLLLDEDYNTGAGMQGDDPDATDPNAAGLPKFVISIDTNQDLISGNNAAPTTANVNNNGNDLEDSDDFDGVLAIPTQGSENTSAQDPETNETNPIASYDFGIREIKLGAIGNYVWVDEDSDGLQDEGERGIPNVRVILNDENGDPIDTTYTDSDGKYLFPDLMMGDYFIDLDETSLPTGMSQTTTFTNNVDGDDDDAVTDDGDLGNKDHAGNGYPITLDLGEENLTADFGYNFNPTDDVNDPMGSPTAALGDRIWIDSDGDGVQDANEVGVSGAEVTLTGPGPDGILGTADDVMQTTTTDENGYYLFDNLTPGAYVTEVTDDANASHDILGNDYMQTGDPDHFATSEADNPDDTVEDDNRVTKPIVLGPGDVYLNADYGYQPEAGAPVGSIGNTVWFDADADGNGPSDGDPIGDGDNGTGAEDDNDEEPIAGVSVSLIADANGNGVWDDGELIVATDVTDENGDYLFEGLPLDDGDGDADYIVWVNDSDNVLDGLESTFDEDNQAANVPDATGLGDNAANVGGMSAIALDAGTPDGRDQDFGYTSTGHTPDEGYIGDYVWYDTDGNDAGGQTDAEADMDSGIEGVVMELIYVRTGALISATTTDENGFYFFGNLPVDLDGEEYQVRVSPDNFLPGGVLEGLESTFEPDGDNDNEGDPVLLTTANPGSLDQDFGYTGDDANTLGSIGNKIWEDTDADGVYEPDGQDGTASTADDETPLAGVTVNIYRDLNGDGIINPGEPKYGTMTTDANGMYLFNNLPLGDYIVDVTDEDGVLNGYWHSLGDQDASTNAGNDPMDNSKEDAFAVTIDGGTPDNLNVDFGYYKEPAAVGNYVFADNNANGLQDAGDTPIENVVVQMDITYPDGTMLTLTDTTDADGFYEFPNLLLDEDYAQGAGTGADGEDPTGVNPSGTQTPKYVISVDPNQMVFTDNNLSPTMADVTSDMNDPLNDSEDFDGVVAIPVQGSQNTTAATAAMDASGSANESMEAKYDFGVAPQLDLATNLMIMSMTPAQGYYDEDDEITFAVNVFNQGGVAVSDVTITNYLPAELENAALVASSLMINGMPVPMGVSIMKVGNDYVIDFGTDTNNWFGPDDELTFKFTADITDGTTPNTEITNTVEISSYDTDNNAGTVPPNDVDSVADNMNGGDGETPGSGLEDDVIDEDALNNVGDDSDDHDIAIIQTNVVLPVELLSFHAKADKDHIDLVWSTASEFNNSHFELERSEDRKVFKSIARIQGNGTTLEQTDYSYEDHEAIPNVLYYYRLKQVDFDEAFEYSEVRTAQLESIIGGIELYPNPIGDATELQVRFYTTELMKEFVIMDIHSRSVLQIKQDLKNTGWNTMSIDIQVLSAGTYILIDKQGNSMRFVKARE